MISPQLKQEWALTENVEDIPLCFYLGIIFGSFLAGSLANISGRKNTLVTGLIIQILSSACIVACDDFYTFLFILLLAGISVGITLVTASTLCSEQLPPNYRGRALLFLNFIAICGKLLSVLFAYYVNLKHWRHSQVYLVIVCIFLAAIIAARIPESVRLLLVKGELEEGIAILENMLS